MAKTFICCRMGAERMNAVNVTINTSHNSDYLPRLKHYRPVVTHAAWSFSSAFVMESSEDRVNVGVGRQRQHSADVGRNARFENNLL